jgi:hypothetical protein
MPGRFGDGRVNDWTEQFKENERKLGQHPECAYFWVVRARLLMLEDEQLDDQVPRGLAEVERCILKALDLDPKHLEALEEAAHFYDIVVPDRNKAVVYAGRYVQLAGKAVGEMKAIIQNSN